MNEGNLIPNDQRTPEERRANARKAGIASGKKRKQNAEFKRLTKLFLDAKPSEKSQEILKRMGFDDNEINNAMAIIYALGAKAQKGDANAAKTLYEWSGQSIADRRKDEELELRKKEYELHKRMFEEDL